MSKKQPDHVQQLEKKASSGVDAVDRALSLLHCFKESQLTLTLTQLSQETGIYKSTVLRLCASLERAGYLVRRVDKSYSLGSELLRLAGLYTRSFRLEDHVRPVLQELLLITGESTSFFKREGDFRVCLFREDSLHSIRDHIKEGDRLSLNKGAAGHVLRQFEVLSSRPSELLLGLKSLPYASFGERDAETAAIAVPVFGPREQLIGAISISGPVTRFAPDALARMGPSLVAAAHSLSERLGGGAAWSAKPFVTSVRA